MQQKLFKNSKRIDLVHSITLYIFVFTVGQDFKVEAIVRNNTSMSIIINLKVIKIIIV